MVYNEAYDVPGFDSENVGQLGEALTDQGLVDSGLTHPYWDAENKVDDPNRITVHTTVEPDAATKAATQAAIDAFVPDPDWEANRLLASQKEEALSYVGEGGDGIKRVLRAAFETIIEGIQAGQLKEGTNRTIEQLETIVRDKISGP